MAEPALAPYHATDGPRFARFCELYIRHTQGRQFAGKPLILEPWQREFFDEALAVDENGERYYTEVLWGLPRKNGKSTSCSAFGLYMAAADGEAGAEVYIAAAAKQQARIIFDQERRFVDEDVSPRLASEFVARRNWIEHRPSGSVIRVLSSDAPKQHGLNPSSNIIDELHAHESPDLYTALTTASGAREQHLTLTITTAGWNRETVLGEIVGKVLERRGQIERRPGLVILRDRENGFLYWWHGAPDDADPDDPETWRLANPASWISDRYLARERRKPSMRLSDFRQLHLNQWVNAEEDWLPPGAWEACLSLEGDLDPDLPIAVGIDVALTHDYASIAVAQRQGESVLLRARFWSNPFEEGHPDHAGWELDLEELRAEVRRLGSTFRAAAAYKADEHPVASGRVDPRAARKQPIAAPGPAFLYDPWKFTESAQILRGEGLNMIEFPMYNRYMVPASMSFYESVVTGRVRHDGDPTLSEHVGNARGQRTDRGWRIRKPKDKSGREIESKHIDGAVASAMATWQALQPIPVPFVRKKRPMVTT